MTKTVDLNMNALRTLAICMVILLHVNAESLVQILQGAPPENSLELVFFYSVLTRIAVPIFILISGRYVLASAMETPLKIFYRKRIPRLLIPLCAWSLIYYFICVVQDPTVTPSGYFQDFLSGFAHNDRAIHLWYLYMLIPLYLVAPFLARTIYKISPKYRIILFIALCVCGTVIEAAKNLLGINYWFFWWLEFLGLFIGGYVLTDYKPTAKKNMILGLAIILEIAATICSLGLYRQNSMLAFIFHWGVVPHTQIVAILLYIYFNAKNQTASYLSDFSVYVLGIYLLHVSLIPLIGAPQYTGILGIDILIKAAIIYFISLACIVLFSKVRFLKRILQ